MRQAKKAQLLKVNYGSDLRQAYIQAYDANHKEFNLVDVAQAGVDRVVQTAENIIHEVNEVS